MEPPVVTVRYLECEFIILKVILTYINIESVGGHVVIWTAYDLNLLRTALSSDQSALYEFLSDLDQIILITRDVQRIKYALQMGYLHRYFPRKFRESLIGAFQFVISVIVFLSILRRSESLIKRYLLFPAGIVVQDRHGFISGLCAVSVCI